jgi:hypothetical protein
MPIVTAGAFGPFESVVRCISPLPPEILERYNAEGRIEFPWVEGKFDGKPGVGLPKNLT